MAMSLRVRQQLSLLWQNERQKRRSQEAAVPLTQFSAAVGGQSLAEYPFIRGTPRVAANLVRDLRTLFGFSTAGTVTSYTSGKFFHDGSAQAAEDWTVRLDNYASGGSSLLDTSQGGSQIASGNYWWNTQDNTVATGSGLNTINTPGPLWRTMISGIQARVTAGKAPNAFVWSQGTNDLTADVGVLATYKAKLKDLFAAVRTASGNAALPVFILKIHRHQTASDTGMEPMRQLQREVVAEMTNIYFGAEEYPHLVAAANVHTGVGMTLDSNVFTKASTTGLAVNDAIFHANIPLGAYILSLVANTSFTLIKRVNGGVVPANATASLAAQTVYRGDDVHLYPGADGIQPLDTAGGTTHDEVSGFYAVFKALARRIASVFAVGGVTASRGPFVSSGTFGHGAIKVRAGLTHDAGSDFTIGDTTGWRVTADGVAVPVIGVSKINATTVDLSLGAPLVGTTAGLQYAYGGMNFSDYTQFIRDNASPVSFPMQARSPLSGAIAAYSAGAGPLSVTLVDRAVDSTSQSTYAFAGRALGAAAADRRMLLGVGKRSTVANTLGPVLIGGVIASPVPPQAVSGSNLNRTAFFVADVPSGTTGDIVITTIGTNGLPQVSNRCSWGLWRITGGNTVTAIYAAANSIADPASVSLDGPANCVMVGYGFAQVTSVTAAAWTGLTELFDEVVTGPNAAYHTGAQASFVGAGLQALSCDWSVTPVNGGGVVFVAIVP